MVIYPVYHIPSQNVRFLNIIHLFIYLIGTRLQRFSMLSGEVERNTPVALIVSCLSHSSCYLQLMRLFFFLLNYVSVLKLVEICQSFVVRVAEAMLFLATFTIIIFGLLFSLSLLSLKPRKISNLLNFSKGIILSVHYFALTGTGKLDFFLK